MKIKGAQGTHTSDSKFVRFLTELEWTVRCVEKPSNQLRNENIRWRRAEEAETHTQHMVVALADLMFSFTPVFTTQMCARVLSSMHASSNAARLMLHAHIDTAYACSVKSVDVNKMHTVECVLVENVHSVDWPRQRWRYDAIHRNGKRGSSVVHKHFRDYVLDSLFTFIQYPGSTQSKGKHKGMENVWANGIGLLFVVCPTWVWRICIENG